VASGLGGRGDNVADFLASSGLSDPQMHAIGHGNAEALLRI
jgi:outer membrane protein OmpA-like peptidoglycan-associated protein